MIVMEQFLDTLVPDDQIWENPRVARRLANLWMTTYKQGGTICEDKKSQLLMTKGGEK